MCRQTNGHEFRINPARDQLAGLDQLGSVSLEDPGVRCLQQHPGNSAGPEIDVPPTLLQIGVGEAWVARMNEQTLSAIRARLDESAFAEAWEQGRALTIDEAVSLALHSLESQKGTRPAADFPW